jgi:hypothetical protein
VRDRHWTYKLAATLGLFVLVDYDVGAAIKIIMTW